MDIIPGEKIKFKEQLNLLDLIEGKAVNVDIINTKNLKDDDPGMETFGWLGKNGGIKMWVDIILDRAVENVKTRLKRISKYEKRCWNRNKLYEKRMKQGRKGI